MRGRDAVRPSPGSESPVRPSGPVVSESPREPLSVPSQHTEGAEEWREVPGYGGRYFASSEGRIRGPLGIRAQADHGPYVHVTIRRNGRAEARLVHHLVLEAFVGPRPEGLQCRHLNGRHRDNRRENLRWGTPTENQLDRIEHGTMPQVLREVCPMGHPLIEGNLIPTLLRRGHRACLSCNRARAFARGRRIPITKALADEYYSRLGLPVAA